MAILATLGQHQLARIELSLIALLNLTATRPNAREYFDLRTNTRLGTDRQTLWSDKPRWPGLWLPVRTLEPMLYNWNPAEEDEPMFATHPGLLLAPVSTYLDVPQSMALYRDSALTDPTQSLLTLTTVTRLRHLPRGYYPLRPQAHWYCFDMHEIYPDGRHCYLQALHGWHPGQNHYVPIRHRTFASGDNRGIDDLGEARELVLLASMYEDRQYRWQVRLAETTALWITTDGEGIKALASLRDDPRTATGRRAPLLHWVSAHLRRPPGASDVVSVRRYLRGITTFALGSVQVDIREPQKGT